MNQTTTDLLAEVRAEMARQRITVGGLAEKVGMTIDQVSRRLSGRVDLTVPEALTIADALGCELSDLLSRPHRHAA